MWQGEVGLGEARSGPVGQGKVRLKLKQKLVLERGSRCECCGEDSILLDLHEGVVSRADAGKNWKHLIFCPVNCFLLCRGCHTNWGEVFPREKAWEVSCQRYGRSLVETWYKGLPWKVGVPRRFWD